MALQQNFIYTHLVAPFYNFWHTFLPSQCVCPEEVTSVSHLDQSFHFCVVCPDAWKTDFICHKWMSFNNNGPSKCHDLEHKRINEVDGHNEPVETDAGRWEGGMAERKMGLHFMNWGKLPLFFPKAKWCKHKFLSSLPHPAPFHPPHSLGKLLSWDVPNRVDISQVFSGVWENNFLLHFRMTSEGHAVCLWDVRQVTLCRIQPQPYRKGKGVIWGG